jgi:hypothetical protein
MVSTCNWNEFIGMKVIVNMSITICQHFFIIIMMYFCLDNRYYSLYLYYRSDMSPFSCHKIWLLALQFHCCFRRTFHILYYYMCKQAGFVLAGQKYICSNCTSADNTFKTEITYVLFARHHRTPLSGQPRRYHHLSRWTDADEDGDRTPPQYHQTQHE